MGPGTGQGAPSRTTPMDTLRQLAGDVSGALYSLPSPSIAIQRDIPAAIERNLPVIAELILGALPGSGDVMAARDASDYSGRTVQSVREGRFGDAAGNAGMMALASAGVLPFLPNLVGGIKAYHGSPYDFDRFDLSKIGTGEGAQAYGHGLYFAENEGVARSYRDGLAPKLQIDGRPFAHGADATDAADAAARRAGVSDENIDVLRWYLNRGHSPDEAFSDIARSSPSDVEKLRTVIQANPNPGRMYEVDINTTPDRLLDWDKPLSEQSEAVREGVRRAWDLRQSGAPLPKWLLDKPGADVEQALSTQGAVRLGLGNSPVAASRADTSARLRDAGVDGIQYLDGGSRAAGDGTRNYVIFSDDIVNILRKYGILAPLMGAGAVEAMSGAPEQ